MRILAGIVSLLLTVRYSPAALATEWYYVVDANRGTTNGPFQLRNGDGIQIGSNQYQIVQAPPMFDIEKRMVAKVDARGVTPEAVLRQAWADAAAPTNRPLPELVFFNVDTNLTITLNLRRVELKDLVRYVCETADMKVSRFKGDPPEQLQDALIFQPSRTRDDYETQVYVVGPQVYSVMSGASGSILKFLVGMGVIENEGEADVQYRRDKHWLIIRAPPEAHRRFRMTW